MTTKEEVEAMSFKKMTKHLIIALACCCVDVYLSSTAWASIALWAIAAASLMAVGFVAGIVRATKEFTK